ncbi:L-fucose:H+ symporter permease [Parasegetibacter sp. NRK P23]|uniref:L-fucose:H+ symporter permease n=1 Tax=Parasegetibacter sp. NRK P23 TaxID=2942999 RepID=UPI002042F2CD|nr:L-fucose:H+ symporter permease [Parasegetibacter sp. NRK P23]MCM5527413.1 L-fucose:H+ symporter permease [Parasegetibacter sp. NRK P23]
MALPTNTTVPAKSITGSKALLPLILVISLFFFWGFIHNLDPILIAHLRKTFQLNTLQASLVDFAVFIAYFAMALPAGLLMKKMGYKYGIIFGLILFASGALLFLPAANFHSYGIFLAALFIIASGLTFLETAANPYVTVLGAPESATFRLNFAQSFNGLAAFLAPLFGRNFILSGKEITDAEIAAMAPDIRQAYFEMEASSVKMPFLILGLILILVAILFFFTKLPDIKDEEGSGGIASAWKHKRLKWGVMAQFFYVGAQVCVFSFFILYASKAGNITEKTAAIYLSSCGLAFMLGRFAGTFLMKYIAPVKLLFLYAVINIALSAMAIFFGGITAIVAVVGITFFMSIMFPTIFSLGIEGLGKDTKMGSSLIIMAIVGGALLPLLFAFITDKTGNIQYGYFVPLICFGMIALFAKKVQQPNFA